MNIRLSFMMIIMSHLSFVSFLLSQAYNFNYPLAPEIWSTPVRIDSFAQKYRYEYSPSFTPNLDTIYLYIDNGIYTSRLVNGIWQKPERLNENVNGGIIRNPSISKDGKRIYYSAWGGYGAWDLWYNDWDDSLNDWGPPKNMGPVINSPSTEWYLYEVSKDTIYTIRNFDPRLYIFDHSNNEWACVDSFYYHPLGAGGIEGLSITRNKKKLYFGQGLFSWNDYRKKQTQLCVSYWDSLKNNWGDTYFLNINSEAFQPDTDNSFYWIGGIDAYPWISPDGKILIFCSNRDVARTDTIDKLDIYISYLLIDENGDTTNMKRDSQIINHLKKFELFPNYPNPFNSRTVIRFQNAVESTHITIQVFDCSGNEVRRLADRPYGAGRHEVAWDGKDQEGKEVTAGVYFCRILTEGGLKKTIKMALVK